MLADTDPLRCLPPLDLPRRTLVTAPPVLTTQRSSV
jgi:hypothetical protein